MATVKPVKYPEKPANLSQINGDWLIAWAIDKKQVEWLKAEFKANSTQNDNGKMRPNIFVIRKEWAEKFAPEMIPEKKKVNQKTLWEKVMEL